MLDSFGGCGNKVCKNFVYPDAGACRKISQETQYTKPVFEDRNCWNVFKSVRKVIRMCKIMHLCARNRLFLCK